MIKQIIGSVFIQVVLIVVISCLMIYIEKATSDRFHGSSMDQWINECRKINKGKDIIFPDRPKCDMNHE